MGIILLMAISGILYVIWGEITRPRPDMLQKVQTESVLKMYRDAGYLTYHVSVHKHELFFIYLDKGEDQNNPIRIDERVYINVYKGIAFSESARQRIPLPIDFVGVDEIRSYQK